MRRVEHNKRCARAERRTQPECAVDHESNPSPVARRNQLVDGRVDRRILAADAAAGDEAEYTETRQVPRERAQRYACEIDTQCDKGKHLAAMTVGQTAEHER